MRETIGKVSDMAATFKIDFDAAKVTTIYAQMMSNMPGDLMESGIDDVLMNQTDTFRVPMPGLIWKAVEGEYNRRKAAVDRLKTALMIGNRKGWPQARESQGQLVDKKSLDDVVSGALKTLDAATQDFKQKARRHHRAS